MKSAFLPYLGVFGLLSLPAAARADYYDTFNDGFHERDPNDPRYDANDPYWTDPNNAVLWDVDNPDWTVYPALGSVFLYGVDQGWLRMFADAVLWPATFIASYVDDGNYDPNTSLAYFDNSAPHFFWTHVKIHEPNSGSVGIGMHADPLHWTFYTVVYETGGVKKRFILAWYNGFDHVVAAGISEGTAPDQINGFWMVLQFDPDDPNGTGDPSDPNNHWFRAAWWNGGKYDWDGHWTVQMPILNNGYWDPNEQTYWTEGICAVASAGTTNMGLRTDNAYDCIECRWGTFSNVYRALNVTVKTLEKGTVTIDPDLLENETHDPNDPNAPDPNDPNEVRRYTDGTEVALVAHALEGNAFRTWKILDPNHPHDPNYVTKDSNAVLFLTMNADYHVEAIFKCSSGVDQALPPLVVGAVICGFTFRHVQRKR
jgi:hypothetical protein